MGPSRAERSWAGKPALAVAALLAGVSGLGLEILFVTSCGLTLGYGRSGPIGIATFLVGWALGARWSGSLRSSPRRVLWITGLALAVAALVAPQLLIAVGARAPGGGLAWLVSCLALFAVAFPQGIFLPQLARGWSLSPRGDLGALIGWNLAGAAVGAVVVGHQLPGLLGRPAAAAIAGGVALLAGLSGAVGARAPGAPDPEPRATDDPPSAERLPPYITGLILAAGVGWLGTLEWLGLRLGVLWLGGMQESLTGILLASMISLSIGAWLGPKLLGRSSASIVRLLVVCAASSLALLHLTWLAEEIPLPAWLEPLHVPLRGALLIGPALLPFGALVPVLHRHTAGSSGRRLGGLLSWEALGVVVGLPISHLILVPALEISGTVVFWLLAPAASMLLLVPRLQLRAAWGLVAVGALALVGAAKDASPALDSPPLQNPALTVLDFTEDRHFAVSVVQDGVRGERTLLTDGFRAAATGRDYRYMRALGHLPLLLHAAPRSVAVLAFGTGTTAGAVSLHEEVESIEVLELSRAVTDRAHWFDGVNLGVLEDAERVTLRLGDGRRTLAERRGAYDVVTMEPLLPDSPFAVYLYTEEFYGIARRALAPGGMLCQWVPAHALEPRTFEAVVAAFTSAFEWSGVWLFGTQVILLGSEARPTPRRSRFPVDGGMLHRALDELGFADPEGVLARYATGGESWPDAERPLTDGDPWIVYRPRRSGAVQLADLPTNLALLRRHASPIPTEWWVGLGEDAPQRFEAAALLRRAREAFAVREAEARGLSLPDRGPERGGEALLADAMQLAPRDPEGKLLSEEREFLEALRGGVGLLLRSPTTGAGRSAVPLLESAVALRPERADVWLYLGAALRRARDPRESEALERARELCPRVRETIPAPRLQALGLTLEGAP